MRKAFASISKSDARKELGLPEDATAILSAGGSLGAKTINDNALKLFKWYQENDVDVYHIHSYGTYKDYENYPQRLEENGVKIKDNPRLIVKEYINMPLCMAACDLIISRCGASTVLENAGAGIVIEEKNLDSDRIVSEVSKLINNKEKMKEFSLNARKLYIEDTPDRIYGVVSTLI